MNEAALRRGIEKIIERPVNLQVWSIWKEGSPDIELALEEMESGQGLDVAVDSIVDEYELLESVRAGQGQRKRTRAQADVKAHVRLSALGAILAIEAQNRPDVQEFRSGVLRGNLVKAKNIGRWVERRRRADPPVTYWRKVPVEHGGPVRPHDACGYRPVSESVETLEYTLPGAPAPSHVLIAADGVLGRLKTLCEVLADQYTWREAYALALVLSGVPPPLPLVRVTKNLRAPYPMLGVIDLQVNPSLSTGELAPFYTAARRDFMPGERGRDIAPETAELGVFASRVNDGRTWDEARAEWNDSHARRFETTENFTARARDAYKKITGCTLDWQRAPGERLQNRGDGR